MAAEMDHRRLEAHPRAQRRFLEQQRHHTAGQQRLTQALLVLGFKVLGDRKDAINLGSDAAIHGGVRDRMTLYQEGKPYLMPSN